MKAASERARATAFKDDNLDLRKTGMDTMSMLKRYSKQLLLSIVTGTILLQPLLIAAQSSEASSPQADVLDKQIKTAFGKKDYEHLLELIHQRHSLGEHFPAALWYVEAAAYFQLGKKEEALQSLNSYFPQAVRGEYPYNEAVDLAASIRDELDTTHHEESTILWEPNASADGRSARHGSIEIDGQRASLIGVTLACTYIGVWTGPGSAPYVRLYEDTPTDSRHLPLSSFPSDVPVSDLIGKYPLVLTVHLLTGDSPKRFPASVRPPWNGWYNWNEKQWYWFEKQEPNGIVLWDRARGSGPSGSASRYNDVADVTYWQQSHWNRSYDLTYLDSYRISFPSMQTTQTITLKDDFHQGPDDPNFCGVTSGCQSLRTTVLNRFSELQPTECTPRAYSLPDGFAQAVAAAKHK
jgi:hypothetical protein